MSTRCSSSRVRCRCRRKRCPSPAPSLPVPALSRWQPLRLGLVELFHYDSEEFWFRDGHLLLKGNNGTGKSKVLSECVFFCSRMECSEYIWQVHLLQCVIQSHYFLVDFLFR